MESTADVTTREEQFGVRYPDGQEEWETIRRWFGNIDSREMRASFQEQYALRMASFGLPPMPVTFLKRTVTTTVSGVSIVDDSEPAPDAPDVEPGAPEEETPIEPVPGDDNGQIPTPEGEQ